MLGDGRGEGLEQAGGIEDEEDEAGLVNPGVAALYAEGFDLVGRVAQPCGVDEAEEQSIDVHHLLHRVARRAVDVADDGTLLAEEGVEEGAFAHVGRARQRHGDTLLDGIAEAEALHEALDLRLQLLAQAQELAAVGEGDILLAEVQLELHQGRQLDEALAELGELTAVAAAHLREGHAVLGCTLGGDEVGHGLGTAEVHLAVEVGAAGVFAWLSHAAALVGQRLEERLLYVEGAVASDLHHVLACVAVRGIEAGDQHLVEKLTLMDDPPEVGAAILRPLQRGELAAVEDLIDDAAGFAARDADEGDAADTRGGGYGADRIAH